MENIFYTLFLVYFMDVGQFDHQATVIHLSIIFDGLPLSKFPEKDISGYTYHHV